MNLVGSLDDVMYRVVLWGYRVGSNRIEKGGEWIRRDRWRIIILFISIFIFGRYFG